MELTLDRMEDDTFYLDSARTLKHLIIADFPAVKVLDQILRHIVLAEQVVPIDKLNIVTRHQQLIRDGITPRSGLVELLHLLDVAQLAQIEHFRGAGRGKQRCRQREQQCHTPHFQG